MKRKAKVCGTGLGDLVCALRPGITSTRYHFDQFHRTVGDSDRKSLIHLANLAATAKIDADADTDAASPDARDLSRAAAVFDDSQRRHLGATHRHGLAHAGANEAVGLNGGCRNQPCRCGAPCKRGGYY